MPPINASSQYRIRKGESIVAVLWSNAVTVLAGRWRVVYDDGTEDDFVFNEFTTGSSRAAQLMTCNPHVANKDGIVVGGMMTYAAGSASLQRGQCYIAAFISADPVSSGAANIRSTLACGYMPPVSGGAGVCLGSYVEAGPAGGHGHLRTINIGNPAAGADFADATVPTGAMWKLRGFNAQLVAAAAAANRELVIKIFDGTQVIAGTVATEVQTTGQTEDYFGSVGNLASGVSTALGTGAIGIGLPDIIFAGSVRFQTYNINIADDWGQGFLMVEEWVMPN